MCSAKTWEASVWLLDNDETEKVFHGSSLFELRNIVSTWLVDNTPANFSNIPSNHDTSQRNTFTQATEASPVVLKERYFSSSNNDPITSGWVGIDLNTWPKVKRFESIQEVSHYFAQNSIKIKRGPDWKGITENDGKFPLHLIRVVKKIKHNEDELNDHLQSGWYLLSINYTGNHSNDGNLISRDSVYIIGHAEEDADLFTIPN